MIQGRVCVVDDDASVRRALCRFLTAVGYEVATFESGAAYLASTASTAPSCLLLDLRMPGMNGLELQQRIAGTPHGVPVIFITGHGLGEVRGLAMAAGSLAVLDKPLVEDSLLEAIEGALAVSRGLAGPESAKRPESRTPGS